VEPERDGSVGGSDAELITRVRGGDRAAFGVLYGRHAAAAGTLARQFARSAAEADDLVSESFARVLDALLGGRGPDTAFRAYLFTTLRNTAFDRTRKDSKLQFTDDVAAHETAQVADDPVVLELENTLVAKAFAALPERWQTVLWHTQVEEQSPAEVGVLLGMSANAVTSLAFRAREGLREAYLQAHLADTAAERCRTTVDRLGGWARGGLSKRERAQVDAHLSECDRCRALAAELAEINTGLRVLLAPLLLGGAAAGYLAASSSGVAVPLVAGAAAGGTVVGGAAAAGASAGSGSSGGVLSFLARPWTIATAGAGVAAAAVVAVVIAVAGTGNEQPLAGPPPVAPATHSTVTSTGVTSAGVTSAPAPPAVPTSRPQAVSPVAPPSTPRTVTRSSAPATSSVQQHPAIGPGQPGVTSTASAAPPTSSSPATSSPAPSTPASSTPASSTPARSSSSAPPAAPPAVLSPPTFQTVSLDATAGAPATVRFAVANTGGTDSDSQTAQVTTPAGVTLAGATGQVSPATPALRRYSALLSTPTLTPDGEGPVTCTASSCTYSVPAHSVLTITLRLTLAPGAANGAITLRLPGATPVALPVSVGAGLTAIHLGDASTSWRAASTLDKLPLTASVAPGVTNPGTIILPLRSDELWITDYPATCTPVGTDAIRCTPSAVDGGRATFGVFSVTVLPDASGAQRIRATLPGGRSGEVLGAGDGAIDVTAARPGGPIDMTGPFAGTVVGAPTLYCAGTSRTPCQGDTDGQGHHSCQSETNPMCHSGMATFEPPIARTLPIPDGATLVSAQLTWAMSTREDPQQPVPADAGSVNLLLDGEACAPAGASARCVTGTRLDAPEPLGALIGCDSLSPCPNTEVAQWVADVTDLVRNHHTLAVTDLDAPASGTSRTPMGAWALALIWSAPGAATTSVTALTPAQALAGQDWTCTSLAPRCADRSAPVQTVATALWGVDDLPGKSISIGDGADSVIASYRAPGDPDDPDLAGVMAAPDDPGGWLATGLDIDEIFMDRQLSGPLVVHSSGADLIWVGMTLVVRRAG